MSDGVIHLAQYQKYDEDEMWCGVLPWPGEQTREIEKATCVECLACAIKYGNSCLDRWAELRNVPATRHTPSTSAEIAALPSGVPPSDT